MEKDKKSYFPPGSVHANIETIYTYEYNIFIHSIFTAAENAFSSPTYLYK